MDITVTFPGGLKVDAQVGNHVVHTDQSAGGGGDDSAASPFNTFLAALAACAGVYVLSFCMKRGLPTEGVRVVQSNDFDPETHRLTNVRITIEVPKDFPEKYYDALIRSADQCAVKKAIANPPHFIVETKAV
jgi:putative redox protein